MVSFGADFVRKFAHFFRVENQILVRNLEQHFPAKEILKISHIKFVRTHDDIPRCIHSYQIRVARRSFEKYPLSPIVPVDFFK